MGRQILIVLSGMSPAVITETAYALCSATTNKFIPDEVVCITTTAGADCIKQELLESGIWEKLRLELGVQEGKLRFGLSSQYLRIIPSGHDDNADAGDIITSADNSKAANYILDILRQFTENPDTSIVFSIAGGRKTMSAIGALCMSLLGRQQDQLCHILVNPPFDNPRLEPKFYWPAAGILNYSTPDGKNVFASEAQLNLCNIPFVRLRNLFEEKYLRLPGTFGDTVEAANQSLAHELPELIFDAASSQCRIGEVKLELSPFEFLLYWTLADQQKNHRKPFARIVDLMEAVEECADTNKFNIMTGFDFKYKFSQLDEKNSNNPEHTAQYCVKVTSTLKKKILKSISYSQNLYLPSTKKGVYGLKLPPEKIKFE